MKKFLPILRKLFWVIGLFIFVTIGTDLRVQVRQTAQMELKIAPVVWFDVIYSILVGLYIALLLVKSWSIKINHSLLWCVAVPCLLFLLIYPTISTLPENFTSNSISERLFLTSMYSQIIIGIITGVTLTLSLFSHHSKDK